jgi:hypothetical protein
MVNSMSAAVAHKLETTTRPRAMLLRLVQPPRVEEAAEVDAVLDAMETVLSADAAAVVDGLYDLASCDAEIQQTDTLVQWMRGAVGAARKREVLAQAPSKASRYAELLDKAAGWYEEALQVLQHRRAFLASAEETARKHASTFRVLAQ